MASAHARSALGHAASLMSSWSRTSRSDSCSAVAASTPAYCSRETPQSFIVSFVTRCPSAYEHCPDGDDMPRLLVGGVVAASGLVVRAGDRLVVGEHARAPARDGPLVRRRLLEAPADRDVRRVVRDSLLESRRCLGGKERGAERGLERAGEQQ